MVMISSSGPVFSRMLKNAILHGLWLMAYG
jgi:hypothetical protein